MATVPSTLIIYTEDKIHFPIETALIVMKQLFRYGVKELSLKGDKVFISLSYSPRASTLKRKFGNLPIRYMRANINNDEEFRQLEKVIRRYKYNLLDEEIEDRSLVTTKRKLYLEPLTLLDEEEVVEVEDVNKPSTSKKVNHEDDAGEGFSQNLLG